MDPQARMRAEALKCLAVNCLENSKLTTSDVLAGFSSLYIQDEDRKEHKERLYFNPQCPCSFTATTGITHAGVLTLPLWEELALFPRANFVKMDIKCHLKNASAGLNTIYLC